MDEDAKRSDTKPKFVHHVKFPPFGACRGILSGAITGGGSRTTRRSVLQVSQRSLAESAMCPSSLGFIFTVKGCFNDRWPAKRRPLQADDGLIGSAGGWLVAAVFGPVGTACKLSAAIERRVPNRPLPSRGVWVRQLAR